MVTTVDGNWCFVKKFVGNKLRAFSYKVKRDKCYLVPGECDKFSSHTLYKAYESDDEEGGHEAKPPEPVKVPQVLTSPSEVSILLALPELSTGSESIDTMQLETGIDLSEASHDLNIQPQASGAVITPQTSTRLKRQTKRPKYLEDYVLGYKAVMLGLKHNLNCTCKMFPLYIMFIGLLVAIVRAPRGLGDLGRVAIYFSGS